MIGLWKRRPELVGWSPEVLVWCPQAALRRGDATETVSTGSSFLWVFVRLSLCKSAGSFALMYPHARPAPLTNLQRVSTGSVPTWGSHRNLLTLLFSTGRAPYGNQLVIASTLWWSLRRFSALAGVPDGDASLPLLRGGMGAGELRSPPSNGLEVCPPCVLY